MGKSLSIAAITISIYNINGYAPGQPIGDDYPLHPSLEKLRSKLIYRREPLLPSSEIKDIHSRQLLAANALFYSHQKTEMSFEKKMNKWSQEQMLPEFHTFYDFFMKNAYAKHEPDSYIISLLKAEYKTLTFHPSMLQFIQHIMEHYETNPDEYQMLAKLLSQTIFDHKGITLPPSSTISDEHALMLSLENVCKKMLEHPEDPKNIWLYSTLYEEAKLRGLLPDGTQILHSNDHDQLNQDFLQITQSFNTGFIIPARDLATEIAYEKWDLSGKKFLPLAQYLMPIEQYPYLLSKNGNLIIYEFLLKLLQGKHDPEPFDLSTFGDSDADEQKVINLFRKALIECFNHKEELGLFSEHGQQMGQYLRYNNAEESLLTQSFPSSHTMTDECRNFWSAKN